MRGDNKLVCIVRKNGQYARVRKGEAYRLFYAGEAKFVSKSKYKEATKKEAS